MSPLLLAVLRQLSHEDFLSGEVLAKRLGCSRATVNNAIREAAGGGVSVHAVHGRGYRLARPLSWLAPDRLRAELAPRGASRSRPARPTAPSWSANGKATGAAGGGAPGMEDWAGG